MKRLPRGWVAGTLGDFAEPVRVGVDPASVPDVPYLGLEHVQAQTTDILGTALASSVRSTSYEFEPGATLFARLRPYLNKVCSPTFKGIGSGEFIIFPARTHLAPGFLKYLLNQPAVVEFTSALDTGDRPRVNWSGMRNFPCALPPLAEQKRIVTAIDEQFSRLDAGVGALKRIQRNLGQMRSAVLARAVHGWPETPLENIAQVFVGSTPSRSRQDFWGGEIPWVSSGEVAFCRIRQTRETITDEGLGSATRLHPAGTVLLAMIGEGKTRGQAAILDVAAAHNQNSAAVRLDKRSCLPEWLFYVLMARYEETRRGSSGGNQPALNSRRVRAILIPLPALDQQRHTVREIEQRLSLIGALATETDRMLHRGEVLRAAILGRAFTGTLVPQDSNDEPASVLLERVVAKRTSSNGAKHAKARSPRRRMATA